MLMSPMKKVKVCYPDHTDPKESLQTRLKIFTKNIGNFDFILFVNESSLCSPPICQENSPSVWEVMRLRLSIC